MSAKRYASFREWDDDHTGTVIASLLWRDAIAEGEARERDRLRLVTDDAAAIADAIALLRRKDYNDVADELEAATSRVRKAPRLPTDQAETLRNLVQTGCLSWGEAQAIRAALAALGEAES